MAKVNAQSNESTSATVYPESVTVWLNTTKDGAAYVSNKGKGVDFSDGEGNPILVPNESGELVAVADMSVRELFDGVINDRINISVSKAFNTKVGERKVLRLGERYKKTA